MSFFQQLLQAYQDTLEEQGETVTPERFSGRQPTPEKGGRSNRSKKSTAFDLILALYLEWIRRKSYQDDVL
jgi:hypothetical protein